MKKSKKEFDLSEYLLVPKILYTEEKYRGLSSDAKIVFSLLLAGGPDHGGGHDEAGRWYVEYPVHEIRQIIGGTTTKISKIFRDLEEADLITRKRIPCKPARIYITQFGEEE